MVIELWPAKDNESGYVRQRLFVVWTVLVNQLLADPTEQSPKLGRKVKKVK